MTGEIERVLDGHDSGVLSVAFSPDGTRVEQLGHSPHMGCYDK